MEPEEKKELEVINEEQGPRPNMLAIAMEKGIDGEQLSQMMELQERWEKNEARKAYHVAMAAFKANPPKINKDASVSFNQTSYKHATLANVTEKINRALSEHGLSAAWQTEQKEKQIAVTCKITHILGHSESTTLEAPADDSGKKNSIQAIGSTVTYLQRYTILSLTGLATSEMDDDGRTSEGEAKLITEDQQKEIANLIVKAGAEYPLFLKYLKIDKIEELQADRFDAAMKNLNQKLRVKTEGEGK